MATEQFSPIEEVLQLSRSFLKRQVERIETLERIKILERKARRRNIKASIIEVAGVLFTTLGGVFLGYYIAEGLVALALLAGTWIIFAGLFTHKIRSLREKTQARYARKMGELVLTLEKTEVSEFSRVA